MSDPTSSTRAPWPQLLLRRDVLSGLLFIVIAALGLWISRNYPIGTAMRMGTGYVPRLLCWILLALGVVILFSGLRGSAARTETDFAYVAVWRPAVFVTAGLVIFGLSLQRLGLVVSILLLIAVGAFAARGLRPAETAFAAVVLVVLTWAIFIFGLGITIPVWPEW
jgi:hypothetical protein